MRQQYRQKCLAVAEFFGGQFGAPPKIAVILGSGLGQLADQLKNPRTVQFASIPGYPVSTVAGHSGEMIVGELNGVRIAAQKGRVHMYEGHSACDAAIAVRAMAIWGVKNFIITNAAGGLDENSQPGDLMAITNDYSFGIESSSLGVHGDEFGPQFFDVTRPYDAALIERFNQICDELKISYYNGAYYMCAGPRYESACEILDLVCRRKLILASATPELAFGAVGMSTVPEVHALAQMRAGGASIRVLGVSMISNLAAGIGNSALNHAEVLEMGKLGGARLKLVLERLIPELQSN